MSAATHIDLCICTFRRPQVVFTLRSVAALEIPAGYSLRVIVADNDTQPSAQVMVETAAAELGLNLTYLHAPAQNISIARNACLAAATAHYIAFIDDDEIVAPNWLSAMLAAFDGTAHQVVLGPVNALYPEGCAAWLRVGDFHSTRPVWRDGTITTGYAGNVMMHFTNESLRDLRFREDLGVSGGEDTDYFSRAHRAGASIGYAEGAVAIEGMSDARATLRWLLRRRWRFGLTHAMSLRAAGRGGPLMALIALAKALLCALVLPFMVLSAVKTRYWLLRGTFHLAVARSLFTKG